MATFSIRPFQCMVGVVSLGLLYGCANSHRDSLGENPVKTEAAGTDVKTVSSKNNSAGAERVFTNANVTMWVPVRASLVWDGHTSAVEVDRITPPNAMVQEYKIHVDIQIIDTGQESQQLERWSSDWYFQEHPVLSTRGGPVGLQIRKDIWDDYRKRRLLINGMVQKRDTFTRDVETAKRMIESIKLIPPS